MELSTET